MPDGCDLEAYLQSSRELALAEIRRHVPRDTRHTAGLYELMLDYPLRPAKALRPALCLGVCAALGGNLDAALPSAAAFELFHNAFLVHDDIEDDSLRRRHAPALHVQHGVPVAVNVGDGMLAIALGPLLDNVRVLGLGPALRIFSVFARMARESVEGQMLELDWVRRQRWDVRDLEYLRMVHKKTGWYSFIAPLQVGAIAAGADARTLGALGRFGRALGIAFQIQDDLLSLEGSESVIGKDALGDLWEGKYTLALLHALRTLPELERRESLAILRRARPAPEQRQALLEQPQRRRLLERLEGAGGLELAERELLRRCLLGELEALRSEADVLRLQELVAGRGRASVSHARRIADRFARRAARVLGGELSQLEDSLHKRFLGQLVSFVTQRGH